MSLTASSTLSQRARCLKVASLGRHQYQQTRAFRFDKLWSKYLDAEFHRYIWRTHQDLRQKYMETLSRQLSWGEHSLSQRPWRTDYPKSCIGGRWANTDTTNTTFENPDGVRPGQNIEDVERAPLEHLLFGNKDRRPKSKSKKHASPKSTSPEYIIDAITNRKVYTSSVPRDPLEDIIKAEFGFKSYGSQFSPLRPPPINDTQAPIFYDGPPPESELKLYGEVKIDAEPWDSSNPASEPQHKSTAIEGDNSSSTFLDALNREYKDIKWQKTDVIGSTLRQDAPVYDDLHKYRAVADLEPHLLDGAVAAHETEKYEDLEKYGAVRWHEPNGKSKIEPEQAEKLEELGKYDAVKSHEPDGKYKVDSDVVTSNQELDKYEAVRAHEPDGRYAVEYTDPNPDPAELAEYNKPFLSHEPDGKYAEVYAEPSLDEVELGQYKEAFRSHEPDGKYSANSKPTSHDSYGAFRSHEPDGKYAAAETATADDAMELDQYNKPFGGDRPARNYAAPRESATKTSDLGNHEAFTVDDSGTKVNAQGDHVVEDMPKFAEYNPARHSKTDGQPAATAEAEMPDAVELDKYQAVEWNEPDGQPITITPFEAELSGSVEEKTDFQKRVEKLMSQPADESSPLTEASTGSESKASDEKDAASTTRKRRLSGQYVQDFPEDFAVPWTATPSETKSSLLPTDINTSVAPPTAKTTPEAPQSQPKAAARDIAAVTPKSTLYKILAYDPVMQAIDVAEISSIVPDTATPLTPADVLLRISNPARFFPHFAPLQAQGFEIVSGSGDVLIFRKVRDALDDKSPAHVASMETASASAAAPVNPIDMTGGGRLEEYNVAAGRFASPTGFVNYEWPPDRSDVYTRREEPVLNETKCEEGFAKYQQAGGEKKKSLSKRLLIGAASLAGISYSIAIVGDQLKTGVKEVKPVSQKP